MKLSLTKRLVMGVILGAVVGSAAADTSCRLVDLKQTNGCPPIGGESFNFLGQCNNDSKTGAAGYFGNLPQNTFFTFNVSDPKMTGTGTVLALYTCKNQTNAYGSGSFTATVSVAPKVSWSTGASLAYTGSTYSQCCLPGV